MLIDYTKFSWLNDSPEFNDIEQLKTEHLNTYYKCFEDLLISVLDKVELGVIKHR